MNITISNISKIIYCIAIYLCLSPNIYALTTAYQFEDKVYRDHIKSTNLSLKDNPFLTDPILTLGSNDKQLLLQFDDIKGGFQNYWYTIIQVNHTFTEPSRLITTQYLSGFFEDQIINYQIAFNTLQRYTHYTLAFPNQNIQINQTGAYILLVYENHDKDKPILTRKFYVLKPQVNIETTIRRGLLNDDLFTKQKIDVQINLNNLNINLPADEIKLVIQQNGRLDNIIYNVKPTFINGKKLQYTMDNINLFSGNNDFRQFDTRSLNFNYLNVVAVTHDSITRVILHNDIDRSKQAYTFHLDANGRFVNGLLNQNATTADVDYAWVYFNFTTNKIPPKGQFYIYGGLTDWHIDPNAQLYFDSNTNQYQGKLYLKQGYYDYQYAFIKENKDPQTEIDFSYSEGNFYETEHNYQIFVYYRPFGAMFDNLIGYTKFNTMSR